jgi:hypothetical protein
MAMNDADAPVANFDFTSGALRGSHVVLYPACLVHRGRDRLETIPIAAIAALRIGFERELRAIRWAAVLLLLALIVFALSGPLASLAGAAAAEVATHAHGEAGAGRQSVADILVSAFRGMQTAARLLPVLGGLLGAGGAALAALGWLGYTTLTLTLGAAERAYSVRGRNRMLFDFTEILSERMLKAKR